jgi:hypothetical protein
MFTSTWLRNVKGSLERRSTLRRTSRPRLEALEDRCLLSVYTVTSTSDANTAGTLRYGLNTVSNGTIDFNIPTTDPGYNPTTGKWTISATSQEPSLQPGVFINGLSQGVKWLVILDGTHAGLSDGLLLPNTNCTVSGLIIQNFGKNGIEVANSTNTIGGTANGGGDVISGNGTMGSYDGVMIDNLVNSVLLEGNYIGINYAGTAAQGNSHDGIGTAGGSGANSITIGGVTSGARNVLSGNGNDGVYFGGSTHNLDVEGNYIGTNAAGTAGVGNRANGIEFAYTGTSTIGGTVSGAGNLISSNGTNGITLGSPDNGILIAGNFIGTDYTGTSALGNSSNGIQLSSGVNTVGGTTAAARNIISGNHNDGIAIGSGNLVLGNYIGTNVSGTSALGNSVNGIEVDGGASTLGGTTAASANVISGNGNDGILLDGSNSINQVVGNLIGTDYTGTKAVANSIGVYVARVATGNQIGGSGGVGNTISGNTTDGIYLVGPNNKVQDNYVGTNAAGTAAVSNSIGIEVNLSTGMGETGISANLVSGNTFDGLRIDGGTSGIDVFNNTVGTNAAVTAVLGNSGNGIEVQDNSNTIGGGDAAEINVIAGNSLDGVLIDQSGSYNQVTGNLIGTNAASATLGNGGYGVRIAGTAGGTNNNSIGASTAAGNTIAYNKLGGVLVSTGTGNGIHQNSIYANGPSNTGPGITLSNGANNNVAAPTLNSATLNGGTLTVSGTFYAPTAGVSYTLEFFASPAGDPEGKVYLGQISVTAYHPGTIQFGFTTTTFPPGAGPLITATLTDGSGDTSEFSGGVTD